MSKETNEVVLDHYEPDYTSVCIVCGNKPTVTGVAKKGDTFKTIYKSEMCGPCTFGSASTVDPEEWN